MDSELVEVGHAVRLGPERHLTEPGESPVRHAEQWLAIEGSRESVAFGAQRERMPNARRHLRGGAGELLAVALDHPVDAHVVLERVRPHEVVVVRVPEPDGEPTGPVTPAGNSLEAHAGLDVLCWY